MPRPTDAEVRASVIRAGIRNLTEFGYPGVTAENIVTDYVFRKFFKSMLEEESNRLPRDYDHVRVALIAEIDARILTEPKSKRKKGATDTR